MKKNIIFILALFLTGFYSNAQIDRSKMPVSGPSPKINLGEAKEFKLKNGLQVLVVEDQKLPTITFSLNLNNPPVFEGEKAGVQTLASALLGKGTLKTPKDQFNEEVEFLGASINLSVNGGFGSSLSKYTKEVFEMFAEAAFLPNFTQEELDFEKEQLIEGLKSGENSAAAIAGRVRNSLIYGKQHAAGEFLTEETIANVTLEDVKSFYKEHFKPSNGYLVVTGDICSKKVKKLLKKNFKSWEKGSVATPAYPSVNDVSQTEINFIDVPNAVQTELAIVNTTELKMNEPDYYAALVTNYIFGGGFNSYLNMNLREANGFTYGARSSLRPNRYYKSTFLATSKVRNEVTDSAVVEVFKEMDRIRTSYVDQEVLTNAKAKFLGDFIMQSEDKSVGARRAINIKTNNLPKDYYKNFIANINSVTKEDIKKAANKYFKLDNLRIILVGKASDVLEKIESISWKGATIPVSYFDKEANPSKRPSTISIPKGATAKTVLDNYIKAIGGKKAIENINSTFFNAVLETPAGNVSIEEKRMKGNAWRLKMSMAGNVISDQVYANGKGKVIAQGQTIDMEGELLAAQAIEALFFPELNAQSSATLVGAEVFNDKKAFVIKWSDSKTAYYDMESGLLLGTQTTTKQGEREIVQKLAYSDYKEKDGIKFPMVLSQEMGGRNMAFNIKEVLVNKGVSPNDFK